MKINHNGSDLLKTQPIVISTVMMLILSVLAFIASIMGLLKQEIYNEVLLASTITKSLVFGSIVQDIISVPASLLLMILSIFFFRKRSYKIFIAMLGLTAYIFYGYALYSIQGQYTSIYLVYLTILGLSLYSLIFGIFGFSKEINSKFLLPKSLRISIGIFLAIILLVLIPAWIGRMAPDILKRVPGEVYGVFVLDLCIVFPAFAIIVVKLFKENSFGNVLAGIALIKTFTLCISVALGELLKPINGFTQDISMIIIFIALTVISAILSVIYFTKLKITVQR